MDKGTFPVHPSIGHNMSDFEKIRELVGDITKEQMRDIDYFIADKVGLFMPVAGPCMYALSLLHTHPSYMFVLPFNNKGAIILDGNKMYTHEGKIQAVSPWIPHHEVALDSLPRYIAVFIQFEFFKSQLAHYSVEQNTEFRGVCYNADTNLLSLLKEFMIEYDNKLPGSNTLLKAKSLEICHSIIRSIFNIEYKNDRITNRMELDRVIEYLHTNTGKKITLDDMAAVARMSSSHFTRLFKEATGKSPVEYLMFIRLERVKKLLLDGDRSITQIALECGFNSSAYLSASFRRHYKISPSEYQNNLTK